MERIFKRVNTHAFMCKSLNLVFKIRANWEASTELSLITVKKNLSVRYEKHSKYLHLLKFKPGPVLPPKSSPFFEVIDGQGHTATTVQC